MTHTIPRLFETPPPENERTPPVVCVIGGAELPAFWIGMALQLSCGVTLVAWVTIALFDALVVSSLNRGRVFTIGVCLSATYVVHVPCVHARVHYVWYDTCVIGVLLAFERVTTAVEGCLCMENAIVVI